MIHAVTVETAFVEAVKSTLMETADLRQTLLDPIVAEAALNSAVDVDALIAERD